MEFHFSLPDLSGILPEILKNPLNFGVLSVKNSEICQKFSPAALYKHFISFRSQDSGNYPCARSKFHFSSKQKKTLLAHQLDQKCKTRNTKPEMQKPGMQNQTCKTRNAKSEMHQGIPVIQASNNRW